jgi:hypothetical protein
MKDYELSKTAESLMNDIDELIVPPFKDDEKFSLEELLYPNATP